MVDVLYAWPKAAHVNKRIPKEKFYEQGISNSKARELFVSEVQRVSWSFKLAQSSVNLVGSEQVPEIQVFTIECKSQDVSTRVLAEIDRAIPFPIIFEVVRTVPTPSVRTVAAQKVVAGSKLTTSDYFSTSWLTLDHPRTSLPLATNLEYLYLMLLEPLLPLCLYTSESVSEVSQRIQGISVLEHEIKALERKMLTEKQFNRKVELRRLLKTKQDQLNHLR